MRTRDERGRRLAVRRYPWVTATVATGGVGGLLEAFGPAGSAQIAVSAFALVLVVVRGRRMVMDLRAGTYGVDMLAVLSVAATVLVGEYWAALVVCLMLSGGEALETSANGRARRELTALLAREPRVAQRAGPEGTLEEVPVDRIRPEDEVWVRPGEVVPVDGLLLTAAATFDESSLTGESLPVEHHRGDPVLSGSVAGSDAVRVRATATAATSQYQAIIELVKQAQASKAPFVRLADRVAVPFTVVALLLAAAAWALSGDATRFAEVLVVATPCPLIIAAPVAFMSGMSRAASNGIIVKSAGTLELLSRVRTVALDKTGTLTRGAPVVAEVLPVPGRSAEELLALAASVEQYSVHALAAAIVRAAHQRGIELSPGHDVVEETARGARAAVDGHAVAVGKLAYVGEDPRHPAPRPGAGQIGVHVAVDGSYAGTVLLADELRPEARHTLVALRGAGVRTTVMLTGDAEVTARHVADQVGIDDVRAGLLPQDKVDAVRRLPDRPVLMVGDGVNDAPVLAVADIGMAMGARGSTAATESADAVAVHDDLARTVTAVRIGQRTVRVAWQAIALGIGLSSLLMVVAATGRLPALAGAWLQEGVDLACILWALLATRPGRDETRSGATGQAAARSRASSDSLMSNP
ncbi:heavy metal-(Cd/Co/Hg/Pb/Zn)-translocating P-type ATPase [Isoptericola sp. CG 20/1183]|uniref:Heavy metal-(Cd/Co/Hg/Pb/Zn)-translocating P-type ATPase n=1 Tax=Isoptericola halotolerans TaxID=300560 RepID=A0ABX5ELY2_9MICO|nr:MULTISPECIES: heavy metal translocating P-type ATPase [Isoptericola]PRZ09358.1 heavy metal-(Cd/Co/Hg/Pb/Zn)-translocating P-type ATPase [Isoptericola sp. CG 20/1183]PRZ10159.1 heavy metal-(Cd/Co/Hg/Pb/Zn)-translocating P-type ATPase [Isoptericola halotolerans]